MNDLAELYSLAVAADATDGARHKAIDGYPIVIGNRSGNQSLEEETSRQLMNTFN